MNSVNEAVNKFLLRLYKAQIDNIDEQTVRKLIIDFANQFGDNNVEFIEKVNSLGFTNLSIRNVMGGQTIFVKKPYITLDGIEYLKQLQKQLEEIKNQNKIGF